jgi:hypothetical protein
MPLHQLSHKVACTTSSLTLWTELVSILSRFNPILLAFPSTTSTYKQPHPDCDPGTWVPKSLGTSDYWRSLRKEKKVSELVS